MRPKIRELDRRISSLPAHRRGPMFRVMLDAQLIIERGGERPDLDGETIAITVLIQFVDNRRPGQTFGN